MMGRATPSRLLSPDIMSSCPVTNRIRPAAVSRVVFDSVGLGSLSIFECHPMRQPSTSYEVYLFSPSQNINVMGTLCRLYRIKS